MFKRILLLASLLFFYFLASVLIFREKVSRKEIVGVVLLIVGIVVLVLEKTY